MQYDDDTLFRENNVTLYLAEVEEYISLLITYIAYKQENPDAAISALSLEKMLLKEFDKGSFNVSIYTIYLWFIINLILNQIDAPNINMMENAETEDDVITNGRDLFKKFENLA